MPKSLILFLSLSFILLISSCREETIIDGGALRDNLVGTWTLTPSYVTTDLNGTELNRIDEGIIRRVEIRNNNTFDYLPALNPPEYDWFYEPGTEKFLILKRETVFQGSSFGSYFDILINEVDRVVLRGETIFPANDSLPDRVITETWVLE